MDCGAHRGIKFLEHGVKVLDRVLKKKLREKVTIDKMQFGFMPGKKTTDATLVVRQMQEKFLAKKKVLFFCICGSGKSI